MHRRRFLSFLPAPLLAKPSSKAPTILLLSGWQTINIGDIAHTPGVLAVIERIIPGARVVLWPGRKLDLGVEPMLRRRFPSIRILDSSVGEDGSLPAQVKEAFREASLLMHGSAASMGSNEKIQGWKQFHNRPFGYFGVGFTEGGEFHTGQTTRDVARQAQFIFTREKASLRNLAGAGFDMSRCGFAPDGTFSMDILDEDRGLAYLREHELEPGKFICLIPRLRYTPYHKVRKVDWSPEEITRRESVNKRHAEADQAKLREVAIAWIRKTGGKVLLCPEMTYEIDMLDPLLYDPLPSEIKPNVVRRKSYWLPDEASSVYKRAAAVISLECHSPILAAAHGTPCMYVHQPEDGIKGHMYPDLGLGDWYFEVESTKGADIAQRVLQVAADPESARNKVRQAVRVARKLQDEAMGRVKSLLA